METHRQYPYEDRAWPTACFSFRSMGPGYCRHAQMSVVTPKRKAPPQHVQGLVTLSRSRHLGRKTEEIP